MTLTVDVLDRLHAEDVATATHLVQRSADGAALIELLEMLWSVGIPRAQPLIGPVLERLSQLRQLATAQRRQAGPLAGRHLTGIVGQPAQRGAQPP